MIFVSVLPHEFSDGIQREDTAPSPEEEARLVALLDGHFGDGSVYLPSGVPGVEGVREAARDCLVLAQTLGLVGQDGYMTQRGYQFWRQRAG